MEEKEGKAVYEETVPSRVEDLMTLPSCSSQAQYTWIAVTTFSPHVFEVKVVTGVLLYWCHIHLSQQLLPPSQKGKKNACLSLTEAQSVRTTWEIHVAEWSRAATLPNEETSYSTLR